MAGWRQAVALAMTDEEIETLTAIARSRSEPAAGWSGRNCFWRTVKHRRSLLSGKGWACITRPSNGASSECLRMARWHALG